MNVLPGIESCRLLGWHLNVNLVSVHQRDNGAARSLVQEALLVLIIGVHQRLVVLEQRHPDAGPFTVDVVSEVVDAGDLAGEDPCLGVVVLPAVVEELVELHGHPDPGEGGEELCREGWHLVDSTASLAFLALVAVWGLEALYPWPHLGQVLSHGRWSGWDHDRGTRGPGRARWPLESGLARGTECSGLPWRSLQPCRTGLAYAREAGGSGYARLPLSPRQPWGADGTTGSCNAWDARGALKTLGTGESWFALWPHEPRDTRQPRQAFVPSLPLGPCGAWQPPQPGGPHFPREAWLSREPLQARFTLGTNRSWWPNGATFSFGSREASGPWGAHDAWQPRLAWLPWGPPHARWPRMPLLPLWPQGPGQATYSALTFGPGKAWLPNAREARGPWQAWQALLPFATREARLAGDAILAGFANAREARRALDSRGAWGPLQPQLPRGSGFAQGSLRAREANHAWLANPWQPHGARGAWQSRRTLQPRQSWDPHALLPFWPWDPRSSWRPLHPRLTLQPRLSLQPWSTRFPYARKPVGPWRSLWPRYPHRPNLPLWPHFPSRPWGPHDPWLPWHSWQTWLPNSWISLRAWFSFGSWHTMAW